MTNPLTTRDLHTLIATCSPRDALMVRLMASTGLRVSELVALNVGQLREAVDGSIRLHTFKGRGNVRYDHDHQTVFVHDALLADLLAFTAHADVNRSLFVNTRGERLTTAGVRWLLKNASKRAGIQHVHPHALRHYFATQLMENETPLHTVQALGRWKSPAMALRYSHASTASKRAAAMTVRV